MGAHLNNGSWVSASTGVERTRLVMDLATFNCTLYYAGGS